MKKGMNVTCWTCNNYLYKCEESKKSDDEPKDDAKTTNSVNAATIKSDEACGGCQGWRSLESWGTTRTWDLEEPEMVSFICEGYMLVPCFEGEKDDQCEMKDLPVAESSPSQSSSLLLTFSIPYLNQCSGVKQRCRRVFWTLCDVFGRSWESLRHGNDSIVSIITFGHF